MKSEHEVLASLKSAELPAAVETSREPTAGLT